MSAAPTHSLTRDNIQRLLANAGGIKVVPSAEPSCRPHDWRQCRCFNPEQLQKLEAYAGQVAAAVGGVFTRFCRRPFVVKVVSTGQQYALQAAEGLGAVTAQDCFLPLGPTADKPSAVLGMSAKTARHWAQLLLGTTDSTGDSQGLSTLERALLADIAKAVVETLSLAGSGLSIQACHELVSGSLPIRWDPMEELFKIAFSVQKTDDPDQSEAVFLLPCAMLAGLVGKTAETKTAASSSDASKRLLQFIQDQELPVSVTVRLGTVVLSFAEVMGLAPDDVVVLDQSVEEPIDVVVRGQEAFRGLLAQDRGRMAVLITEAVPLSH